ncbi:uncharacterized protein [Aristolochia californica]|uniref:uncharacterized protein n=1 Tax=Aristolochia californica TaxID=171875 RepID=UPI0035E3026C
MVISWLINSMEDHVATNVINLETSKDIWDTCAKLYSSASLQRVYDVFQSRLATKQVDNIHEFLAQFCGLLQEWKIAQLYSTDLNVQEKQYEALAVAICLNNIKPTMLLRIPDPSPPSPIDAPSAMFTGNRGTSSPFRGRDKNTSGGRNRGDRTSLTHSLTKPQLCTYCGGQNHLVDSGWKLHGKPNWATTNPLSVNVDKKKDMIDSHSENVTISTEDSTAIKKLKSILDQSSTPPGPTAATTIA